jgi:hypothetical protein
LYWKLVLLSGSFCIGRDCLSTHPANRTTVEVAIQIPAPLHSGGAVRFRTEPLFPCRRNQLTESTSARGAFRAYGFNISRPS